MNVIKRMMPALLVVGLLGLALVGCGDDAAACTCPSGQPCDNGVCPVGPTQPGCPDCLSGCCLGSACQLGTLDSACGGGGQACTNCSLQGQRCDSVERVCRAGSASCGGCAGCCGASGCQLGNADDACGQNGDTCANCTGLGLKCNASTPRVCTKIGCTASCEGCCGDGDCQPGTTATACGKGGGHCVVCGEGGVCDPTTFECRSGSTGEGVYDVILASATVNAPWANCFEISCDLYFEVQLAGKPKLTSTSVPDNNAPQFNQVLTSASSTDLLGSLFATMYDDDYTPTLFSIGHCNTTVTEQILAAGEVVVPCMDSATGSFNVGTVTFRFTKQ